VQIHQNCDFKKIEKESCSKYYGIQAHENMIITCGNFVLPIIIR